MIDGAVARSPTPEDWFEIDASEVDEFEDANDFFELSSVTTVEGAIKFRSKSVYQPLSTISIRRSNDSQSTEFKGHEKVQNSNSDINTELKATLEYGKELQRQIDTIEKAPRPPFESIVHLRERLERENELYRRQFAWQMENMVRFTTNAR
ncbi:hypothetical protein RB195_011226 [Necator americanus]|uniref:Uncharacterized protein n=1 Tax=Necator americanus TaxID=51031 RepID=A0ABR1D1H0_NECAM